MADLAKVGGFKLADFGGFAFVARQRQYFQVLFLDSFFLGHFAYFEILEKLLLNEFSVENVVDVSHINTSFLAEDMVEASIG